MSAARPSPTIVAAVAALAVLASSPSVATEITQREMNAAAGATRTRADVAMNEVLETLLGRAEAGANGAAAGRLRSAQAAWERYRDAQVAALWPDDASRGSVGPLCDAAAKQAITEARTAELRAMAEPTEGDVCAPNAWTPEALATPDFGDRYVLASWLEPPRQVGDFDGDGAADVAVQVTESATGKRGIAILHAGGRAPVVLGAGTSFANGGDDFAWMDAWRLEAHPGAPNTHGAALHVEQTESASAVVYWNGGAYVWKQLGD